MAAGWRRRAGRPDERGASAVEFALILPILVLILGAIIDFGFFFSQQVTINSAARDAARGGVVQPLTGTAQSCTTIIGAARLNAAGGLGVGSTGRNVAVSVFKDTEGSESGSALCSVPSGSTTISGGATLPCTESPTPTTPRLLRVTASVPFTPPFPVPFMGSMNITSKGVFRCEYS